MALSFNNAKNKINQVEPVKQEVNKSDGENIESKVYKIYSQYDKAAKHALSNKSVLANIMKAVIDEYKDMSIPEIISCIEGEITVQVTPIDPGKSNTLYTQSQGSQVIGRTAEDSAENEGYVTFDILFDAVVGNTLSSMIINVEAQKTTSLKYDLSKRAVYYVSRLISSQKQKDFAKSDYDKIKPVYSIWVCMNMLDSGITKVQLQEKKIVGNVGWTGGLNLINIVFIGLSNDTGKTNGNTIIDCLSILFSKELEDNVKERMLSNKYNIDFDKDLREDVENMSGNFKDWLDELEQKEAKGRAEERVEIIKNMLSKGLTLEQISEFTNYSVDEIKNLLPIADED